MGLKTAVRLAAVLAALILPVVLVACGGGAQPAAARVEPRAVADGWELQTLEDLDIALSLPPGWKAINLDKKTLSATISELRKANPAIAELLSGQAATMAVQGIKFFAVDMQSPSLAYGFATNVNIMRNSNSSIHDLDSEMTDAIAEVEKQFGGALDGPILRGKIKAGSGQTVGRINYDVNLNGPGGASYPLSISQYVASAGGDVFIVTCTTLAGNRADYASTFEAMAEGLYFLR